MKKKDAFRQELPKKPLIRFENLKNNQCQYPFHDPKSISFGFCGEPKTNGSYCLKHYKHCHVKKVENN